VKRVQEASAFALAKKEQEFFQESERRRVQKKSIVEKAVALEISLDGGKKETAEKKGETVGYRALRSRNSLLSSSSSSS
jgi:hypothetical protein